MNFEKRFESNFFTKPRYKEGKLVAGIFCLIVIGITYFYWKFRDVGALLHITNFSIFYLNEFWRGLTMNFIHADWGHLSANLIMLYILSMLIYNYFGFYAFPLANLLGASIANIITVYFYPQHTVLLGASTLIYHLWGFWFIIYLFGNRRYSFIMRLLRVFGVGFIILFPTTFDSRTSYLAHFVGLMVGMLIGFIYFLISRNLIFSFERYNEVFVPDLEEEEINLTEVH
jgi:membrane associated rhomboid family serine protease